MCLGTQTAWTLLTCRVVSPLLYPSPNAFDTPPLLDCFWLLDVLLNYAIRGDVPSFASASTTQLPPAFLPKRMEGCAVPFPHTHTLTLQLFSRKSSPPLLKGGCCSRPFPFPPSSHLPSVHLGHTQAHQCHKVGGPCLVTLPELSSHCHTARCSAPEQLTQRYVVTTSHCHRSLHLPLLRKVTLVEDSSLSTGSWLSLMRPLTIPTYSFCW